MPRSGRPRTARNDGNREELERSLEENPSVSTRRRSQQMGMSRSSLQRMLHEMDMFPYKIQLVQELQPQDNEKRLEYAMRLQDLVNGDPGFLQKLIMSDESHFHLNGFVNKQNCRIWGTANPQVIQQHQLHPAKCTVWCGITANEIIGPYFFEDEEGNQVTVTGARYRTMIQDFLEPWVQAKPEQMWFQQDGATAHTARESIQMLQNIFQDRIISRGCEINWPPRSPDLTSPDFFLWGYLKERVYRNKPRTINDLKRNIEDQIRDISPEMLSNVMQSVLDRATQCETENGGHLKTLFLKIR